MPAGGDIAPHFVSDIILFLFVEYLKDKISKTTHKRRKNTNFKTQMLTVKKYTQHEDKFALLNLRLLVSEEVSLR